MCWSKNSPALTRLYTIKAESQARFRRSRRAVLLNSLLLFTSNTNWYDQQAFQWMNYRFAVYGKSQLSRSRIFDFEKSTAKKKWATTTNAPKWANKWNTQNIKRNIQIKLQIQMYNTFFKCERILMGNRKETKYASNTPLNAHINQQNTAQLRL